MGNFYRNWSKKMKSSEHTLTSLITVEGNLWHYHIPRFQREYVWGRNNWSKLLEDIYDNDPGHYMGSIICVNDGQELSPTSELIYEVVDGQQRLTTISLLLAAIYEKLNKIAKKNPLLKEDEDYIIIRSGIKKRLVKLNSNTYSSNLPWGIYKSGDLFYSLRVQPSTQNYNLNDYQLILHEIGILPEAKKIRYAGNRIIYRTYYYFYKNIPDKLDELCDLLERINHLTFIHIVESSQAKAFTLFETLNYRGVPLSAMDIIKNKMLATLEKEHRVSIENSYEQWQTLLKYIPEERDQTRFLRQFYNAFKIYPAIKVPKYSRATSSNIIAIYEKLIKKDAQFILPELIQKAKIYDSLIDPSNQEVSDITTKLVDLDRIGAAPAYTFLLYLFSLPEECLFEPDIKVKSIGFLCKYYFRRNVTDFPGTRDLDTINISLVEQCNKIIESGNKLKFTTVVDSLLSGKGRPASIEIFRTILADNFYYTNDYMARYALTKLDEVSHTREYDPNLWVRNERGQFVWTVEHVFPQGKNIPDAWVEIIANGDDEEAERIQGELVHCLGNLTLSGYNSNLSNQSFDNKQTKSVANVFGSSINIGYQNGLSLNKLEYQVDSNFYSLATTKNWNSVHIKARNEVMVDKLIQLFKFEYE